MKKSNYLKLASGFTLIELMITLAIMIIMLTIMIFNFAKTDNKTVLLQIAYALALNIRQSQVNGISVKSNQGEFQGGYGLHFGANAGSYVLFYDKPNVPSTSFPKGDKQYESISDNTIDTVNIQNGYKIDKVCAVDPGSVSYCTAAGTTFVDIVFHRPDPNPAIYYNAGGTVKGDAVSAVITLKSTGSNPVTKIVSVFASGQISIGQN